MFRKWRDNKKRKKRVEEENKFKEFLEQHSEIILPDYIMLAEYFDSFGGKTFDQYTEEEKQYLLDSFKIMDIEGYTIRDVGEILSTKFKFLNAKDFEKKYLFDVTKVYLLLNSKEIKRPADIYRNFINHYYDAFSWRDFCERERYSILLNAIESKGNILKEMNQKQREKFLALEPRNMAVISSFFRERSSWDKQFDVVGAINSFLDPLTISQVETLSDFSEKKFTDLLNHCVYGTFLHSLLFSLFDEEFLENEKASIDYNQWYIALKFFPEYFLTYLKEESYKNQREFLNYMKNLNEPTLVGCNHSLSSVPEKYRDDVSKYVIENDDFCCLSAEKMEMIFMELFSAYQKNNDICYMVCLPYLVSLAPNVSVKVLDSTIPFLCHETDREILETKIEAIERVRKDIENIYEEENQYDLYLTLLESSKNLSKKKQIKQLKARSSYFKNHHLEDVLMDASGSRNHFEDLQELLESHNGKKHHNQSYRLMEIAYQYSDDIVDRVIQRLENVSSGKEAKQIMDYITQEKFLQASDEDKLEQLENLPGQMLSFEKDGMTIEICGIDTISKNSEQLIFKNKDTGAKIKVKSSNTKK